MPGSTVFCCWQAWEKKDADAGRSKADIVPHCSPGVCVRVCVRALYTQTHTHTAEQAGQDEGEETQRPPQAEETQKRPQERTEALKSRKAEMFRTSLTRNPAFSSCRILPLLSMSQCISSCHEPEVRRKEACHGRPSPLSSGGIHR